MTFFFPDDLSMVFFLKIPQQIFFRFLSPSAAPAFLSFSATRGLLAFRVNAPCTFSQLRRFSIAPLLTGPFSPPSLIFFPPFSSTRNSASLATFSQPRV